MHEAGIINNLIDLLQESIPSDQMEKLDTVEIRIGKMCNVLPESLEFCFRAFVEHTPLKHIRLKIQIPDIEILCNSCRNTLETPEFVFNCPRCGSTDLEITGGNEMVLSNLYLKTEG